VLTCLKDMDAFRVPGALRVESRTVRYTFYALFCAIVADGVITRFLVTGGYGLEGNPFLRAWVGQDAFMALKVSGAFLATLLLWIRYAARPRLVYTVTVVFLAFYTIVLFWNLFVFLLTATQPT